MTNDPKTRPLWTRREAILKTCALLGGTSLIGQAAMLSGCDRQETSTARETGNEGFSDADIELLAEIADTILPETETPGARAAGVGPFIAVMVTDCYSPAEQAAFRNGLEDLERECRDAYDNNFVSLAPAEKLAIAERLDREQFDAASRGGSPHYFRMLKELTVLGYFTSEIGYRQVLDYAETPGRYEPCRDLGPEVRTLASHAAGLSST